jgi:hypothetical protein
MFDETIYVTRVLDWGVLLMFAILLCYIIYKWIKKYS